MDQGTRAAGSVGKGKSKDRGEGEAESRTPEEIQRDIEETRAELGDTVEALAQKADVKSRAKERVGELKSTAAEKKDEVVSKAKAQTPAGASAGAQEVAAKAQQNPLPFAVGGALVAGFVLGRITSR